MKQQVKQQLKLWMMAFCIAMVLNAIWSVVSFGAECQEIRDEVFRVHILANSDNLDDQLAKLAVRDAMVQETGDLFSQSKDKSQTISIAKEQLPKLETMANEVLVEKGMAPTAQAQICRMFFTTRCYGEYTLPAGYYDALRITIGEAQGENWWCVLYPSLCLETAVKQQQLDEVLDAEEQDMITHGQEYQFSFAVVEWVERWKQTIKEG